MTAEFIRISSGPAPTTILGIDTIWVDLFVTIHILLVAQVISVYASAPTGFVDRAVVVRAVLWRSCIHARLA